MKKLTMLDSRPTVSEFRRAIGANVHVGTYEQFPNGREYDSFAYVLNGSATYDFGHYSLDAKAGDIVFLAKGSSNTLTVHQEYSFLYANFTFHNVLLQCEAFPAPSGKKTEDLFHKIVATWNRATPTVKEDCLSLLYLIYSDFLNTAKSSYLHSDKKNILEFSIDYIHKHLDDDTLTIAKIASASQMGERHFRRSFKDAYNISPLRYINMRRITRAKELLRYSNMPLNQIATATGFSSIYYFSSAFKKEVHCSPSEYRKTRQKTII